MPPFKVYKVMQDINQQLYERKDTPEGFIPVYGVVVTVPTGIYTNGLKEFTCDKTFDEVKKILLKGGSIIAVDNNNSRELCCHSSLLFASSVNFNLSNRATV